MPSEVMSMQEPEQVPVPERVMLSSGRYIHFGPFRIDQQRQEVSRSGARLKLQGKVYQTLIILLEKPGEVVTREELRVRLWPADTHVNYDANVNTTVNKLRQALGDSSDKPVYVETIPRKGYCLLVQPAVSNVPGNSHAAPSAQPAEPADPTAKATVAGRFSRSDLWIVLGAIVLIVAGMFLGAGIMRLWINHATDVPSNSLTVLLLRVLTKIVL